jgi:hypothetical protein
MTGRHPKRPRDPNQLAKFIVGFATGDASVAARRGLRAVARGQSVRRE